MDIEFAMALAAMIAPSNGLSQPDDWNWVSKSDNCVLQQTADQGRISVDLSRFPGSDQTGITFVDERSARGDYKKLEQLTVTLEPTGQAVGDGYKFGRRSISAFIDGRSFFDALSKATSVTLSHSAIGTVRRSILSLATAVQALARCEDAKLRSWGIDPGFWHGLRTPPRPLKPLNQIFSSADYPPGYLLNSIGGRIVVRLMIGADGTVQDCVHLNRRADRYFLQQICAVLTRRARFEPAIDQYGKAIAAPYATSAEFAVER